MAKLLIATQDTFTKSGRIVVRGQTVSSDEVDYDGENSTNLMPAPTGADQLVAVEVSAIAPTGPNPINPQQIAPDVVQTAAGYEQAGARLVGEVTLPEKQRIQVVGIDRDSTAQADVQQALADHDAEVAQAQADATADPLDHDGNGKKGGSRKRSS